MADVMGYCLVNGSTDSAKLTTIRDYVLGSTSSTYDTRLTRLCQAASAAIEAYCDRLLVSRSYASWLDGDGSSRLLLPQYPVTAVGRLSVDVQDIMYVECSTSGATVATINASSTAVSLVVADGAGAGTTSLSTTIYSTLTLMAAAISATSGWTATIPDSITYGSYQSTKLRPKYGLMCYTPVQAWLQVPYRPIREFRLQAEEGIVDLDEDFTIEQEAAIYIEYTAGYASTSIPYDMEQVCLELVKSMYDEREGDASLEMEKIGDYEYRKSREQANNGTVFNAKQRMILGHYRRLVSS